MDTFLAAGANCFSLRSTLSKPDQSVAETESHAKVTAREREVVFLIVEGLLDKLTAERLGISYTTVRTHVDRTFQKMGAGNRATLIRFARKLDS
jgi:DNA-binding NarL/FixJ family response regulator